MQTATGQNGAILTSVVWRILTYSSLPSGLYLYIYINSNILNFLL